MPRDLFAGRTWFQVLEQKDKIAKSGAAVVMVAYDEPMLLDQKMMRDLEIPFPILLDPTKETYQRWGLGRTNLMGGYAFACAERSVCETPASRGSLSRICTRYVPARW